MTNKEYEEFDYDKPKVVSKEINLAGDKANCNVCKEADEFFSSKATEADTLYNYNDMESTEGKRIAEEVEPSDSGNIPIPAIEYCKTVKESEDAEPEKICDYVTGFNKSDWDTKLNYKKANDVDDEIDDIFGKD